MLRDYLYNKDIRVFSDKVVVFESSGREILEVPGDDEVSIGVYRGSQDMTIVRIWESQGINERFEIRHQSIWQGLIHERTRAVDLCARQILTLG